MGQVSRAFHYRDKFTFVNLYNQYVRPHPEFACLVRKLPVLHENCLSCTKIACLVRKLPVLY